MGLIRDFLGYKILSGYVGGYLMLTFHAKGGYIRGYLGLIHNPYVNLI